MVHINGELSLSRSARVISMVVRSGVYLGLGLCVSIHRVSALRLVNRGSAIMEGAQSTSPIVDDSLVEAHGVAIGVSMLTPACAECHLTSRRLQLLH